MPGEYRIKLLKGAQKDKENIRQFPTLKANVDALLAVLKIDPFQNPPPYEKLPGNMAGMYSRRINRQHRLSYTKWIRPAGSSVSFPCGRTTNKYARRANREALSAY